MLILWVCRIVSDHSLFILLYTNSDCNYWIAGLYECSCPHYLSGSHCEQVISVSFSATAFESPLVLPSTVNSSDIEMEFGFTTASVSGLVLSAWNSALYQALVVELVNGQLTVLLQSERETVILRVPLSADQYGVITEQVLVKSIYLCSEPLGGFRKV